MMGEMDATAWHEQRNKQLEEERYQLSLDRLRSGESTLAAAQGRDAVRSQLPEPRAKGGLAQARRPYLVGEKGPEMKMPEGTIVGKNGPELMVPETSGTIIPNHKLQSLARRRGVVARARGGKVEAGGEPLMPFSPGERAAAVRAPELAQAGAELGAPTSYNGGTGAPMPVEVVRGMRTTYTNPAPDSGEGGGYNPNPSQNTREFRSLVQARQAYNRGQGSAGGEYVPPEAPAIQATAAADPTGGRAYHLGQAKVQEGVAAAEKVGADKAAYRTNFYNEHGVMDPTTKQMGAPADENLNRIYKKGEYYISQGEKPEGAYAKIAPELHGHYYTPENVEKALGIVSQETGQPITPQMRAKALSGTPEAKAQLYPYIKKSLRAPKPGFWGSAGRNVISPENYTPAP
jgi:hypothetical protein